MLKKGYNIFIFFIVCLYSHTQAQNIDSLKQVIATSQNDSIKIETYYRLARAVSSDDINLAVEYALQSAELAREINSSKQLSESLNYLGILYYGLGNYEQTLNYFYQVLGIYEQQQDSVKLGKVYNNVALILADLSRLEEAISYYNKSLKIKESRNDLAGVAATYSNLGLVYHKLNQPEPALPYFKKSLEIDFQLNDKLGLYKDYSNLGDNYMLRQNFDSALWYYEESMKLINYVEDPYYKAELMEKFGDVNAAQRTFDRAVEKYEIGLQMAQTIGAKGLMRNMYKGLSAVYKELGNFKLSLDYFEKYSAIQDEIFSEEQAQKLAQIEGNYEIQTRENQITLLNKEAEIKDLRIENTQMVLYWLAGIIILIVIIIMLQYRKNAYKSKTNQLLRAQNEEIVEKNKNIMDSILCAKNIQQAILPDDEKLKNIFDEAFVMSKARDIVSGDFYWFAERDNKVLIAAVDCTGHGVPAAFLNVLGNTLLNQIVHEANVISPSLILEELNNRVINSLRSNKVYVEIDDGMDIALCMIEKEKQKICFAGAKRPLYFLHNNDLVVLKGDHFPVGGSLFELQRHYNERELPYKKNDIIYLFTDGVVDQFGGEMNKKFMYSRLKKLLLDIAQFPLDRQKEAIEKEIALWMGDNEQTDDMLFIGVRV